MSAKAIGYTRVSTGAQAASGLGIEAQEAAIRRFCDFKELESVYIYEDPGHSGSKAIKARPSGEALWKRLEESEDEPWTLHLVAAKLDRFWRHVPTMHVELAELEAMRVNVHTAKNGRTILTGGEDVDREAQAYARLFTEFTATIDELERIRISERTAEAHAAKRARGEHVGQIPYGRELKSDGQLYACEPELATLGLIWHLRTVRELSHSGVAKELNKRKRRPRSAKRWTERSAQFQFYRLRDEEPLRAESKAPFQRLVDRLA